MSDEFFIKPIRSVSQLVDARGRLIIVVSSETIGKDSEWAGYRILSTTSKVFKLYIFLFEKFIKFENAS